MYRISRAAWCACGLAVLAGAAALAQGTEVVLHNFGNLAPPSVGSGPYAGVILGPNGNLYGTTVSGGKSGAGVVYRVDAAGKERVLYNFTGGADGGNPYTGVVQDGAGDLYGTTSKGGASNAGVVYKVDPAGNETVLYNFTGGADGAGPFSNLVRDEAGNIFGAAFSGGTAGAGVVYEVDATGKQTVIYNFSGHADGGGPNSLIRDKAGNFFGTAANGGAASAGVVYKLTPAGQQTVLYYFGGETTDGATPVGLTADTSGNLYGATSGGGQYSTGVLWKVDFLGREKVLYPYLSGATAGPALDAAGNLYVPAGNSLYEINTAGQLIATYGFGAPVESGVILDAAGNIYGTVYSSNEVFKIDPTGQVTVLCNFIPPPPRTHDGATPFGSIVMDASGNLYGTTYHGGTAGAGTVYKLDPSGHETLLYSFSRFNNVPASGVTLDSSGNLYGTALPALVYKLDMAGNQTVIYTFYYDPFEQPPLTVGDLAIDSGGNLYGVATDGFGNYYVYKLDPSGNVTTLFYAFYYTDSLRSGVIVGAQGLLYGTTSAGGQFGHGTVYRVNPASPGTATTVHNFGGGNLGDCPYAVVTQDAAGNLYGTTLKGGVANLGIVYEVSATGKFTVLYNFTGSPDGASPYTGVIRDGAGNLYGATSAGGAYGAGAVYKIDTSGHETVLYSFTGGADGNQPVAPLIPGPAGALYGTTSSGGTKSGGVAFAVKNVGGPK